MTRADRLIRAADALFSALLQVDAYRRAQTEDDRVAARDGVDFWMEQSAWWLCGEQPAAAAARGEVEFRRFVQDHRESMGEAA